MKTGDGGWASHHATNGMSRKMREVTVLVPREIQTCGQEPRYEWQIGGVHVESHDDALVETLYEPRTVRVPEDSDLYLFEEDGRAYLCFRRKRKNPEPEPKKNHGRLGDEEPEYPPVPTRAAATRTVVATIWYPLIELTSPVFAWDDQEESSLYGEATKDTPSLTTHSCLVAEVFGVDVRGEWLVARGFWDADVSIAHPAQLTMEKKGSGERFGLGFATGLGQFDLIWGRWEQTEEGDFSGTDALGRPMLERRTREVVFQSVTVEWQKSWLTSVWSEDVDYSIRWDLSTVIGVGNLRAETSSIYSPNLGLLAQADRANVWIGTIGLSLTLELRSSSGWSATATLASAVGDSTADVGVTQLTWLGIGAVYRW